MGILAVKISDEVENTMREVVIHRKGALGRFVEEAIAEKLRKEYNINVNEKK